MSLVASIPSPSSGEIVLGPLHLRAYGLMIALGVLAAVWLAGRRLESRGVGTREDMSYIALWAVPAGIIGSRLYHVITDWRRFEGRWLDAFKIWEGGLGIWGGIGLGVAVGIWAALRRGMPLQGGLSAITPALPLAQAIGRWGNWWNQELFGRPTDLPWALEVSPERAVAAGYPAGTTFHPTFLYESLWCLVLCGILIGIDRRWRVWGTELFAIYVAGYTFMRFWIERIRVDEASLLWGWRVNEVVSLVVFALAVLYLLISRRRPRPEPAFTMSAVAAVAVAGDVGDVDGVEPDVAGEDLDPVGSDLVAEEVDGVESDLAVEDADRVEPDLAAEDVDRVGSDLVAEEVDGVEPDLAAEDVDGLEPDVTAEDVDRVGSDLAAEDVDGVEPDRAAEDVDGLEPDVTAEDVDRAEPELAAEEVDRVEPDLAAEEVDRDEFR